MMLLAIDAGLRETGWAIFRSGLLVTAGVIVTPDRRREAAEIRVGYLVQCLDALVEKWRPSALVFSQPSGLHWPIPALKFLDAVLAQWSEQRRVETHSYTAQEVRLTIAGSPNVPRAAFAYAVMLRLGLLGQSKSTHELEAIAVGAYHYQRHPVPA